MAGPGIEVDDVRRDFGGLRALDGVSFAVRPGRTTGFVGANGAGKTTAMRIVMGVLSPSGGRVLWNGEPVTAAHRRTFGYMPEERGLYPKMPIGEQLRWFARLHGAGAGSAARRVDALLARLGLADRSGDALESLSLGNQQRVQIAVALVHRPAALVLDEPFSGLDPLAVDVMAGLLREQVDAGVPVLFSSHQLELVERLCDDIVIVGAGRVVAAGPAAELRRAAGTACSLHLAGTDDTAWVAQLEGVRVLAVERDAEGPVVVFETDRDGADQDVLRAALGRGRVRELRRRTPTLAELFREVVA
jgi:ABC-2 type transport system ATP-binding protein